MDPCLKKKQNAVEGRNIHRQSSPGEAPTPFQRLTNTLQNDPRCAQEVALGRRVGLYRFCGDIGRGNFSRVKLAVHQLTRDKVAIKVVDRSRLDSRASRMLSREVMTLECVHHPNILRLFEVIETLGGRIHLVTEWIQGGELYNRISLEGPIKESSAALLYKQLLLAVQHMHNLGFVHRDIKAENVLLVTENKIKLADFGFSIQLSSLEQKLDTFCGSPPYAAPELFSDNSYMGPNVDIWSCGILLYFMVVGNMPFQAPNITTLRTAVLKGDYSLPASLSLPCLRLIQRILVHVPARRPSITEILDSQWMNQPNTLEGVFAPSFKKLTSKSSSNFRWFPNRRSVQNNTDSKQFDGNIIQLRFNTNRTNSILNESFLHPLSEETKLNDELIGTQSKMKQKHFFSKSVKKRIGPKEEDVFNPIKSLHQVSHELVEPTSINKANIHCSKNDVTDDEDQGNFVMHPTNTDDLTCINPLEAEARLILENLGIESDMLRRSIENGPRSEFIGAYRIVVHRLQKRISFPKKEDVLFEAQFRESPKNDRRCTIL